MENPVNIWNIKEYEGDGISCPVIPVNLPFHKKAVLFFFNDFINTCTYCQCGIQGISIIQIDWKCLF